MNKAWMSAVAYGFSARRSEWTRPGMRGAEGFSDRGKVNELWPSNLACLRLGNLNDEHAYLNSIARNFCVRLVKKSNRPFVGSVLDAAQRNHNWLANQVGVILRELALHNKGNVSVNLGAECRDALVRPIPRSVLADGEHHAVIFRLVRDLVDDIGMSKTCGHRSWKQAARWGHRALPDRHLLLQQLADQTTFFLQLVDRAVDLGLAKIIEGQALDDFPRLASAADGIRGDEALLDAVAAVATDGHAEPVARAGRGGEVADSVDHCVGGARGAP